MWNDPWHMKLIITFTFCCDNLSKSIVYGSGKSPENSGNFFLVLCGHPDAANKHLRLNTIYLLSWFAVTLWRSDVSINSAIRQLCCSHDVQEQSATAQPLCHCTGYSTNDKLMVKYSVTGCPTDQQVWFPVDIQETFWRKFIRIRGFWNGEF